MNVYCPNCENACSEAAPYCPQCGHPLAAAPQEAVSGRPSFLNRRRILVGLASVAVVAIVVALVIRADLFTPEPVRVYRAAQRFITEALSSPASAQWAASSDAETHVSFSEALDEYRVRSYVDAQNAYGARIRTPYVVLMRRADAGGWKLVDRIVGREAVAEFDRTDGGLDLLRRVQDIEDPHVRAVYAVAMVLVYDDYRDESTGRRFAMTADDLRGITHVGTAVVPPDDPHPYHIAWNLNRVCGEDMLWNRSAFVMSTENGRFDQAMYEAVMGEWVDKVQNRLPTELDHAVRGMLRATWLLVGANCDPKRPPAPAVEGKPFRLEDCGYSEYAKQRWSTLEQDVAGYHIEVDVRDAEVTDENLPWSRFVVFLHCVGEEGT